MPNKDTIGGGNDGGTMGTRVWLITGVSSGISSGFGPEPARAALRRSAIVGDAFEAPGSGIHNAGVN
jgi:hypothetical protein